VTGRTSGPEKKTRTTYPKGCLQEQVREENSWNMANPGLPEKWQLK